MTGLEAEREAEEKERERVTIVGLCDHRLEVAARVDAALADAAAAVAVWLRLGGVLQGLRRKRWRERLEDQDYAGLDARASLLRALPAALLQAAGIDNGYLGSDWQPLVSLDAAGWTKRWLEDAAEDDGPDQGGRSAGRGGVRRHEDGRG